MIENRTSPVSRPTPRLIDELDQLHAHYAEAIDRAIAEDHYLKAEALAAAYERDAVQLIAEREGKTHLLPLFRAATPDTPLRRLIHRVDRFARGLSPEGLAVRPGRRRPRRSPRSCSCPGPARRT